MQTHQELKEKMAKQARFGLSDETCRQVQELIHQVAKEKIDAALQEMKRDLGFEASKIDVLAHQMLQIHRMHSIGDSMARRLKEDDLPASFYNAYRHVVKDTSMMLLQLDEQRIKENRKTFVSPEDADAKLAEAQRWNHVNYAHTDRQYMQGYYYDTRYGMLQPALDLPAEQVIERDIVRMRFLPKSPREDAIILDALLEAKKEEDEANAWYEKVNDVEVPTTIRQFDPEIHDSAWRQHGRHRSYASTAKRIYLERLQHYNEVWQKANDKVEGLMEAIGIKIGFRHESIGLPKSVQKAAEGDAEAIKELKAAVAQMQANASMKKTEAEKEAQLEHALNTPFHVQALAIFLAFSSIWTCTTMVFAQPINAVSPRLFKPGAGSRDDVNPNPVNSDNTLSPHDAVKIGILTHNRKIPSDWQPVALARVGSRGDSLVSTMVATCAKQLHVPPGWRHGLLTAAHAHHRENSTDFCSFFPRDPTPGLKSRGLNRAFFPCFSRVCSDTG